MTFSFPATPQSPFSAPQSSTASIVSRLRLSPFCWFFSKSARFSSCAPITPWTFSRVFSRLSGWPASAKRSPRRSTVASPETAKIPGCRQRFVLGFWCSVQKGDGAKLGDGSQELAQGKVPQQIRGVRTQPEAWWLASKFQLFQIPERGVGLHQFESGVPSFVAAPHHLRVRFAAGFRMNQPHSPV